MTAYFPSIRNVTQVNLTLKMPRSYLMRLTNNMITLNNKLMLITTTSYIKYSLSMRRSYLMTLR